MMLGRFISFSIPIEAISNGGLFADSVTRSDAITVFAVDGARRRRRFDFRAARPR